PPACLPPDLLRTPSLWWAPTWLRHRRRRRSRSARSWRERRRPVGSFQGERPDSAVCHYTVLECPLRPYRSRSQPTVDRAVPAHRYRRTRRRSPPQRCLHRRREGGTPRPSRRHLNRLSAGTDDPRDCRQVLLLERTDGVGSVRCGDSSDRSFELVEALFVQCCDNLGAESRRQRRLMDDSTAARGRHCGHEPLPVQRHRGAQVQHLCGDAVLRERGCGAFRELHGGTPGHDRDVLALANHPCPTERYRVRLIGDLATDQPVSAQWFAEQIGRASCRERGEISVVAVSGREKAKRKNN